MNELYVIDVSALVHTGAASKFKNGRSNFGYPVGGLHYLMEYVAIGLHNYDSVVLCFDSPSFRTENTTGYKAGRTKKPEVYSQIEFAYDYLSACGLACYKFKGYEADDIVEWAVAQNIDNFQRITIVGNDHDLLHSIRNKVQFKSVSTGCANVARNNYCEAADSTYTMFNTISAKKVLEGCKSDTIPPIKLSCDYSPHRLYEMFCEYFTKYEIPISYVTTTDSRYLCHFLGVTVNPSPEEQKMILDRIKLVYPAECPEGVKIRPTSKSDLNLNTLATFLTMINDSESLSSLNLRRKQLSEAEKDIVREKGRALSSGEFATDRNLEVSGRPNVPMASLDCFTKEFGGI